ncbi:HAD family hydrolase [Dolichospermum flos-aquae]|uniref:Haloacid dehalogenase-like hydrolase n=1 Tax=Dolichospermum flos-aquae CCAP 1403/13F TaxID=315271 RepID=A0A6H2C2M2_DOLFA|nr:HAD family hydrolase [Dolichospermum flos-aquae]QJB45456.1 haloacid dehalogenase-like hydrolase [Dolichospermum flos-aquae CCAP 1403/13F]
MSTVLNSWNDNSKNKEQIIKFVEKITTQGPDFVPVEDRIAVFDNDGTLWAERPNYFQADFIKSQTEGEEAVRNVIKPDLSQFPENIRKAIKDSEGNKDWEGIKFLVDAFQQISTDEYITKAREFVEQNHSSISFEDDGQDFVRFDAPYIDLTFKPVIELVQYLQSKEFQVYICSGGEVHFVRSFAEEAYGIPPQNIIGSAFFRLFDQQDGGVLVRKPILCQYNDAMGKPSGIELHVGKRPIIAVGNSSGDYQMFQYTSADKDKSLIVLINHDDEEREYCYNNVPYAIDNDHEPLNQSLDHAQDHENWLVVSMKDDFKTIFENNPPRLSASKSKVAKTSIPSELSAMIQQLDKIVDKLKDLCN